MKFYLISPPKAQNSFSVKNFNTVSDIIDIEYFQLRPKHKTLHERLKFVEIYYDKINQICKKKNIKLIINNDFKIAEKFKFDGIHLGQNDKSCIEAKNKFGENYIVGISCLNSYSNYEAAVSQKADYVAFGSVFNSVTKKKKSVMLKNTGLRGKI